VADHWQSAVGDERRTGALASANLPEKSNFQGRAGIAAITGKSNFDISEWMMLRYVAWLAKTAGCLAVLCKTAVARKVLLHCWKTGVGVRAARLFKIDAPAHFGAAVEACFFVLEFSPGAAARTCEIFETLTATTPVQTLSFDGGHVVADAAAFAATGISWVRTRIILGVRASNTTARGSWN